MPGRLGGQAPWDLSLLNSFKLRTLSGSEAHTFEVWIGIEPGTHVELLPRQRVSATGKTQDFLEASPYWDQSSIPLNTYKAQASASRQGSIYNSVGF